MNQRHRTGLLFAGLATAAALCLPAAAFAAANCVTPPDLSACNGVDCDRLSDSSCSSSGFRISLTEFVSAENSIDGAATYTYEICSPAAGICDGTARFGEACLENDFCRRKGRRVDPAASCSRECAVDRFRGLSHFDIAFPQPGASCLSSDAQIAGTCACSSNSSGGCSVGAFKLGDGSCFSSSFPVAKCDNTNLGAGDCLTMRLAISGELNGLGSGPAVVVDKASNRCTASCISGPSCTRCGGDEVDPCLTRTLGFWGHHPWITNDYSPVTVCGQPLGCNGNATSYSDPGCPAGDCSSVIEGLCSIPSELPTNQAYVTMVRQLTAAKLNLSATDELFPGATCSTFSHQGRGIAEWLELCEGLCGADHETIAASGCLDALDAFNGSQDVGFEVTPPPFDQPGVDDFGNNSGADPLECNRAQGNGGDPDLVIGKPIETNDCRLQDEV